LTYGWRSPSHRTWQVSRSRNLLSVEDFPILAWHTKDFYVSVDNVFSTGLYGVPRFPEEQRFKTLTVHLDVERKIWQPLVFVILPLMLIGAAAVCVLFVRDLSFEHVGEVSAAIFLSMVAYSITYYEVTPKSDQYTRSDSSSASPTALS